MLFSHLFARELPIIQQASINECGPICVAMLASYHGHHLNATQMRQHCQRQGMSQQGSNLRQLIALANDFGLQGQAFQGEIEELKDVALPCILHWDLTHFVVLKSMRRNCYVLHDPALGRVQLTTSELSQHFTGVVLCLTPTVSFVAQAPQRRFALRQIWQQISGLNQSIASLLALSILLQLAQIMTPYYVQWTIDHVLLNQALSLMPVLAVGFGALLLFSVAMTALRSWLLIRLNTELAHGFGLNVMQHLTRLPASYYMQRHLGDIHSRFQSIHFLRERLTSGIVESVLDGVMLLLLLLVMSFYSPLLTALVSATLALYGLFRWVCYASLQQHSQILLQKQADENTCFLDILKQWRVQLLYNCQAQRVQHWGRYYSESLRQDVRLQTWQVGFNSVHSVLLGLLHVVVVWQAAQAIMAQTMTIGMLLAFMAYQQFALDAGTRLIEQWLQFRLLHLHMNRLADITDTETEQHHKETSSPVSAAEQSNMCLHASTNNDAASLTLEQVSYCYPGAATPTLQHVSIHIPAGESVVITGASGVGKSTLLNVMLGLFVCDSGRVLFNGTDIKQLGLGDYRSVTASILQGDGLVRGTVLDNITLFAESPDVERIQYLLKQVQLIETIQQFPMGLETQCGELGDILSAGQLQRLLLVRALYRQPQILFLDEATSHLDAVTEQCVLAVLNALPITIITVAHRRETIAQAKVKLQLNAAGQLSVL
jgi:ATP-binding cassette subfamily B protein RaxB